MPPTSPAPSLASTQEISSSWPTLATQPSAYVSNATASGGVLTIDDGTHRSEIQLRGHLYDSRFQMIYPRRGCEHHDQLPRDTG